MHRSFLKIRYMLAFDARLKFVLTLLVLTLALLRLLLEIRIALILYAHHQFAVVPLAEVCRARRRVPLVLPWPSGGAMSGPRMRQSLAK